MNKAVNILLLITLLQGVCPTFAFSVQTTETNHSAYFGADSFWLFRLKTLYDGGKDSSQMTYRKWPLLREKNQDVTTLFHPGISYELPEALLYDVVQMPDQLIVIQANFLEFFFAQIETVRIPLCFDLKEEPFQIRLLSEDKPYQPQCEPVSHIHESGKSTEQMLCHLSLYQSGQRVNIAVSGGLFDPDCSIDSAMFAGQHEASGFYYLATYSSAASQQNQESRLRENEAALFDVKQITKKTTSIPQNIIGGGGYQDDFPDKKRRPPFIALPEFKLSVILPGWPVEDADDENDDLEGIDWGIDTSQTSVVLHYAWGHIHESLTLSLAQWELIVEHNVHRSRGFLLFMIRKLNQGEMHLEQLSEELSIWIEYQESEALNTSDDEEKQRIKAMIESIIEDYESLPMEESSVEGVLAYACENYLEETTGWEPDRPDLTHQQYLDALMSIMVLFSRREASGDELRRLWGDTSRLLFEPLGKLSLEELRELLTEQNHVLLTEIIKLILPGINEQKDKRDNESSSHGAHTLWYNMPRQSPENSHPAGLPSGNGASKAEQTQTPESVHPVLPGSNRNSALNVSNIPVELRSNTREPAPDETQALVPTSLHAYRHWIQHSSPLGAQYHALLQTRLDSGELSPADIQWFVGFLQSQQVPTVQQSETSRELRRQYTSPESTLYSFLLRLLPDLSTEFDKLISLEDARQYLRESDALIGTHPLACVQIDRPALHNWIEQHTESSRLDQVGYHFLYGMHCQFSGEESCASVPEWFITLIEERYCRWLPGDHNLGLFCVQPAGDGVVADNPEMTSPTTASQVCTADAYCRSCLSLPIAHNTYLDVNQKESAFTERLALTLHAIEQTCRLYLSLTDKEYELPVSKEKVKMPLVYPDANHYTYLRFRIFILRLLTYTSLKSHRYHELLDYLEKFPGLNNQCLSHPDLASYFQTELTRLKKNISEMMKDGALVSLKLCHLNKQILAIDLPEKLLRELVRENERVADTLVSSCRVKDAWPLLLFLNQYSESARTTCLRLGCQVFMQMANPWCAEMAHQLVNTPFDLLFDIKNEALQLALSGDKPKTPEGCEMALFLKQQEKLLTSDYVSYEAIELSQWGAITPLAFNPSDSSLIYNCKPDYLIDLIDLNPDVMIYTFSLFQKEMQSLMHSRSPKADFINANEPWTIKALVNKAQLMMFYNRFVNKGENKDDWFYYLFSKLGFLPCTEQIPPELIDPLPEMRRYYIDTFASTVNGDKQSALRHLEQFGQFFAATDRKLKTGQSVSKNLPNERALLKAVKLNPHKVGTKVSRDTNTRTDARHTDLSEGQGAETKETKLSENKEAEDNNMDRSMPFYHQLAIQYSSQKRSTREVKFENPDLLKWAIYSIYFPFATGWNPNIEKELALNTKQGGLASFYLGVRFLRNGLYKKTLELLEVVDNSILSTYLQGMIHFSGKAGTPDKQKARKLFHAGNSQMIFKPSLAQYFTLDPEGAISDYPEAFHSEDEEVRLLASWYQSPSAENLSHLKQLHFDSKEPRVHFRLSYMMDKLGEASALHCHSIHAFFNLLTPANSLFFIADPFRDRFITHVNNCIKTPPLKQDLAHVFFILEKLPWIAPEQKASRLIQRRILLAVELVSMLPNSGVDYRSDFVEFFQNKSVTFINQYIKLAIQARGCASDQYTCLTQLLIHEMNRKELNTKKIKRLMNLDKLCDHCLVADLPLHDKISFFERLDALPKPPESLALFYDALKALLTLGQLSIDSHMALAVITHLQKSRPDDHEELEVWLNINDSTEPINFYHQLLMKGLRDNPDTAWLRLLVNTLLQREFDRHSLQPLLDHLIQYFLVQLDFKDSLAILKTFNIIQQFGFDILSSRQLMFICEILGSHGERGKVPDWSEPVYSWIFDHVARLNKDDFTTVATMLSHYARQKWPGNTKKATHWLDKAADHPDIELCQLIEHLAADAFLWENYDRSWLQALYRQHQSCCAKPDYMLNLLVSEILSGVVLSDQENIAYLFNLHQLLSPEHPEKLWFALEIMGEVRYVVDYLLSLDNTEAILTAFISKDIPDNVFHEVWESLLGRPFPNSALLTHVLSQPQLAGRLHQRDLSYLVQLSTETGWSVQLNDLIVKATQESTLRKGKIKESTLLHLFEQVQEDDNVKKLFSVLFERNPEKLALLDIEKSTILTPVLQSIPRFTYEHVLVLAQQLRSASRHIQTDIYPRLLQWADLYWLPSIQNQDLRSVMKEWLLTLRNSPALSSRACSRFLNMLPLFYADDEREALAGKLLLDTVDASSDASEIARMLRAMSYLVSMDQGMEAYILGSVVTKCHAMLKKDQAALEPLRQCFFWSLRLTKPSDMMGIFTQLNDPVLLLAQKEEFQDSFRESVNHDLQAMEVTIDKEEAECVIDQECLWSRLYWVTRLKHWRSLIDDDDHQASLIDAILQKSTHSWHALLLKNRATNPHHPIAEKMKRSTLFLYYRRPEVRNYMSPEQLAVIQAEIQALEAVESAWSELFDGITYLKSEKDLSQLEKIIARPRFHKLPGEVKTEWQKKISGSISDRLVSPEASPDDIELMYKLVHNHGIAHCLDPSTMGMIEVQQLKNYFYLLEYRVGNKVSESIPVRFFEEPEMIISQLMQVSEDKDFNAKVSAVLAISKLLRLRIYQLTRLSTDDLCQDILATVDSIPTILPDVNQDHIAEAILLLAEYVARAMPQGAKPRLTVQKLMEALNMLVDQRKNYDSRLQVRAYEQLAIFHELQLLPKESLSRDASFYWRQALVLKSVKAPAKLGLSRPVMHKLKLLEVAIRSFNDHKLEQEQYSKMAAYADQVALADWLDEYPDAHRILRNWEAVKAVFGKQDEEKHALTLK